jgi:hypothetical protein
VLALAFVCVFICVEHTCEAAVACEDTSNKR